MVKVIIWIAVVVVVLILLPMTIFFVTFMGDSPIPDGLVLNQFATTIKDGFVSCFMFDVGKHKVALIDAGNDPQGKAILAALQTKGFKPEDVQAVLLTHGDRDHTAACPLFPKAKIYCSEVDKPIAEGLQKPVKLFSFLMLLKPSNFKVTNILKDGKPVRVGKVSVQVHSVPGHTAGSMVFFANGVLFMGDSCWSSSDGEVTPSKAIFCENQAQSKQSIKALAYKLKPMADKIKILAFAHSGPLFGLRPLLDFADKQR